MGQYIEDTLICLILREKKHVNLNFRLSLFFLFFFDNSWVYGWAYTNLCGRCSPWINPIFEYSNGMKARVHIRLSL